MLIVDSTNAPKLARGAKQESRAAQIAQWVKDQTANCIYVREHDLSPANCERQLGQQFWPHELEARLKKLDPNLHFEVNSFNPKMKALYHLRRGEGKFYICSYHNSIMPENSIMKVKEELVQDLDFVRTGANGIPSIHLDRKDLTAEQLKAHELDVEAYKRGYSGTEDGPRKDPDVIPLGMKKVLVPWGEYARGWRTITIKLVEAKLTTPTAVENIFGSNNRAEWARHLGKQKIDLPW